MCSSDLYNIIEHILNGLRPFGLKCVSIYYINYLRKLPKVFISPTSDIRANGGVWKAQQRTIANGAK